MKTSRLIVAGAAALLPLAAAMAQAPQTPPAQQPSLSGGASFESLDTNGDGRISKTEAAANENVNANFSNYDINGDGFIERAEVSKANSSRPATPKE